VKARTRWLACGVVALLLSVGLARASAPLLAAQDAPPDTDYPQWLASYLARQRAALQAVPSTFDLASPAWRRELALALDAWGQLGQEARDQRPPATAAALHAQLLQALEPIEQLRRLLLVAVATGEPPPAEWTAQLRAARDALAAVAERAGAPVPEAVSRGPGQVTRGNLRITLLGVQRPYLERGAPTDPAWEYVLVRLRLENLGGDPIRYDAFQFRLRMADETLQLPTPLQVPDELLGGALDSNRLAGQIVGNLAYAVRKGVPVVALWYERQPGESPLVLPLAATAPVPTGEPAEPPAPTPVATDPPALPPG
jgi:hypothetical protein